MTAILLLYTKWCSKPCRCDQNQNYSASICIYLEWIHQYILYYEIFGDILEWSRNEWCSILKYCICSMTFIVMIIIIYLFLLFPLKAYMDYYSSILLCSVMLLRNWMKNWWSTMCVRIFIWSFPTLSAVSSENYYYRGNGTSRFPCKSKYLFHLFTIF